MMNIVLIGFMGTGKSEVGQKIAQVLGWQFIDTDALIEKRAMRSIPDIFKRYGESHFRGLERMVIRETAGLQDAVISTGGGAVINPENIKDLRKNGVLICLDASPKEIKSRVTDSERPLLKGKNQYQRIKHLLKVRKPYYEQSDATVKTTGRNIHSVVEEILQKAHRVQIDRIRVDLGKNSYDIKIGTSVLQRLGEQLAELGITKQVAIVTNPRIGKLYGHAVTQSLKRAGFVVRTMLVPDGERYKTLKWAVHLYENLLRYRFERGSCIVALGGGVIGDLAGFTAATYLRGIPYVQVPTTLAAQVDASIGGKTAVNHPMGKNLIGAFYQPRLVFIDTDVLKTLSKREYISGLAEVIKYGVIADAAFFKFLEDRMDEILNLEDTALRHAIQRSCEIKAAVVQRDEQEQGRRKVLNYGHTLGHAIEAVTHYKRYLHGEAVSIGMAFAARLAQGLGLCDDKTVRRQIRLMEQAGLPVFLPKLRIGDILNTIKLDKKVIGGAVYFVLADRIGRVVIRSVDQKKIMERLKKF
jgi:shikimate kinase / 3-dehydroquinate synthase